MKTLEQVQAHVKEIYYDCSEKICGFLVGVELKDTKKVVKFLKEADSIFNFDDFLEWFNEDGEGSFYKLGFDQAFHGVIYCNEIKKNCCCGNSKCDEKAFKYQGEQRVGLEVLLKNREDALLGLGKYAKEGSSCCNVAMQCVRNEIRDISEKLEERVNEK